MVMVKLGFTVTVFAGYLPVWPYRHYPSFHTAYQLAHQITPYYTVFFNDYPYQTVFEYPYHMIHVYLILITVSAPPPVSCALSCLPPVRN
jgi:hypothetical protein